MNFSVIRFLGLCPVLLSIFVQALEIADYENALVEFMDSFVDPTEIVEAGDTPLFADDIVGRVDVTTTFEGKELNIEYVYGLFVNLEKYNTTQILGKPKAFTVQSLIVQPPIVYASVILDGLYPTIDYHLPCQLDLTLDYNDKMQIQSYDAVFRRYPQAIQYVTPKLGPAIAKELNKTYSTATELKALLAQRVIVDTCTEHEQYCVGDNKQYESYQACAGYLSSIEFGEIWGAGLNTTICRYIHKYMLSYRPDVHCAHVGPSGGDMCSRTRLRGYYQHLPIQEDFRLR
ncbi:hypothetical protein CYLTODRAFT_422120 [Cylindrobasidium torrendii FP15055 ss-10]|uniref:Uncharacterized protein n=1 Tax=Cylindrobasidium torrendii FP15055 ss-10 TaxID=1314674 RepID=A0A0D7BBM1_9AGAR|nr:hypothetical protein CYLTODRAFT_422120 [Cylindrobasidium torrendii FP15055 ss-10]